MTVEELKEAVLALETEEKKAFVLAALPELGKDLAKEPGFLGQLLPIFLGLVKEAGIDMQQLLQMASLMTGQQK